MTLRHRLTIEAMTPESFAPFGHLLEPSETPGDRRVMTPSGFECDGRLTVHTIWQPCTGRTFSRIECHFAVTQTFVQVSGSPSVVCVAPPTDLGDPDAVPRPDDVRAFLIDPGRGFSFARGTWHSLDRFVLTPPGATFVILNVDPNPTGSSITRTGPRADSWTWTRIRHRSEVPSTRGRRSCSRSERRSGSG